MTKQIEEIANKYPVLLLVVGPVMGGLLVIGLPAIGFYLTGRELARKVWSFGWRRNQLVVGI